MDKALIPAQPPMGRTLTISVDIRPREAAAVVRWGVARTFRWRLLVSPVVLIAAVGFFISQLHRGPPRLAGMLISLLFGGLVAFGAYLTIPYLVGARRARSVNRTRFQLTFSSEGVRVDRDDGESWLSWAHTQVVETAQMLHFVTEDVSCYLPKRLLSATDDALLRELVAAASGRVLPPR